MTDAAQLTGAGRVSPAPWGVSFVICAYNAAGRIPETLEHIAAQRVPEGLDWEVLVVDNRSTDGTAEVAVRSWPGDSSRLRVLREDRPGTSHARQRGIRESRFELIAFVDDDNWLAEDWLAVAERSMRESPRVAALGGYNEPQLHSAPPAWFAAFQQLFAVGPQGRETGEVKAGAIWTAGFLLRRQAWIETQRTSFLGVTTPAGKAGYVVGEDTEICHALRRAGWLIHYNAGLKAGHCIPASRLTWPYLRSRCRVMGVTQYLLQPYDASWQQAPSTWKERLHRTRLWRALWSSWYLATNLGSVLTLGSKKREGDGSVLQLEMAIGHWQQAWRSLVGR